MWWKSRKMEPMRGWKSLKAVTTTFWETAFDLAATVPLLRIAYMVHWQLRYTGFTAPHPSLLSVQSLAGSSGVPTCWPPGRSFALAWSRTSHCKSCWSNPVHASLTVCLSSKYICIVNILTDYFIVFFTTFWCRTVCWLQQIKNPDKDGEKMHNSTSCKDPHALRSNTHDSSVDAVWAQKRKTICWNDIALRAFLFSYSWDHRKKCAFHGKCKIVLSHFWLLPWNVGRICMS